MCGIFGQVIALYRTLSWPREEIFECQWDTFLRGAQLFKLSVSLTLGINSREFIKIAVRGRLQSFKLF